MIRISRAAACARATTTTTPKTISNTNYRSSSSGSNNSGSNSDRVLPDAAAIITAGAVRRPSVRFPANCTMRSSAGLTRNVRDLSQLTGSGGVEEEKEVRTAQHAWEKSCYFNMDYKIDENETVYDAVRRMSAYNVGCLVVTSGGQVSGIITERDYVCKIALLGKQSRETKVQEICTWRANMVAAKRSDTIDDCVKKMIACDIRHLPVMDDHTGEVFGLISVKDLVKEYTKERDDLLCKMIGLPPAPSSLV